ncbi:hypothetical protein GCM10028773_30790 [Spirosoma koreense]
MSYLSTILTVLASILILYGSLCFLAHYLDFGYKFISGQWLHEDLYLIKRIRSGLFHQILIGIILTIVIYGGLSQILAFIPQDWGRMDEAGKLHPYRTSITIILSLFFASITMYGFHIADAHLKDRGK